MKKNIDPADDAIDKFDKNTGENFCNLRALTITCSLDKMIDQPQLKRLYILWNT